MKRTAQKGLAGLLLLVMLLLAVPATALTVLAEDPEPVIAIDEGFNSTEVGWSTKTNISKKGDRLTGNGADGSYYLLAPETTTLIDGAISDGNGGYVALNDYSANFKTVTFCQSNVANKTAQLTNKDCFALELGLPKLSSEYACPAKLRFRYTNLEGTGDTAGSDFIKVADSGKVTLAPGNVTLGNVTDETLHISISAVYSEADSAYLLTVFVNGALKATGVKLTSFGGAITASAYHDSELACLNAVNINGYDYVYGTTYEPVADTVVEIEGVEKQVYTATKGKYADAFKGDGVSDYTFALDYVKLTFGDTAMTKGSNASALLLAANGNGEVPGCTVGLNGYLTLQASDGETTALPEGYVWYDALGNEITSVSSALAGTGQVVAFLAPADRVLFGSDFADGFGNVGADVDDFTHDAVLGKLLLEGNYKVSEEDNNLTDGTGVDCNFLKRFTDFHTGMKTASATLTVRMTLECGSTELVPRSLLRLRSCNDKNDCALFTLQEDGTLTFYNGESYVMTPDSAAAMTFKVRIVNRYDGNGAVLGSTLTVESWCNGVYYGSKTVDSAMTLCTGNSATDFGTVQFQHNKIYVASAPTELYIDDYYVSVDTQEDDAAAYGFSSYSGASIRPASEKETAGLRFGFRFDKDYYDALTKGAESVEVGAYVVPEDYLTGGVLNGDVIATLSASKELLRFTVDGFSTSEDVTNEDTYGFYASIVNLKDYNYARAFRAIAYVTVDGVTVFSTASESRSANQVARNMAKSGDLDGKYASMKALITDTYLDTVARLDASCNLIALDGYTAPYTVTVTGTETLFVKLTASDGFDLDSIKTIVIAGKCYSASGCSITVDPLNPERATELSFTYVPTT